MAYRLAYTVKRGKHAGVILTPHRYDDGFFRAHKSNSRNDPEGVKTESEDVLIDLVRRGYHVRMSNRDMGRAPSTVRPDIVYVD